MEKNKTMLLTLVLLVIAAVVFFNFEKFTGKAVNTKDMTKLYVSSKADVMGQTNPVIEKGDYVYFTQVPGIEGGSGTMYIREMEGDRKWGKIVRTEEFDDCNSKVCRPGHTGTVNFKTYYDWEGKYCGEVTDFATWKKVTTCFTVK